MVTHYQGRHSGGAHRTTSGPGTRLNGPRVLTQALRRPMGVLAAVVAVAGATAAGYSSAVKSHTSATAFTASPVAAAQATELSDNRIDTNAALAQARRSGVQRASALTRQQKLDAEAQAAEVARARAAAAERVSREKARQGILYRAQSDPEAVGRLLAADRGWDGEQFDCLDNLWTKESRWRWDADNPASDAYGIPQALPGSKMSSMGSDWATNPVTQINWGLQYISTRYGTPCSAWGQSQAANWY